MGEPFEKKYVQFSETDIKKVTSNFHNWQQVGFEKRIKILPSFVLVHRLLKLRKRTFLWCQVNILNL